jgi:hypothetical protein
VGKKSQRKPRGVGVGIDNKRDITVYNNLTPLIPLSLQGEGEI